MCTRRQAERKKKTSLHLSWFFLSFSGVSEPLKDFCDTIAATATNPSSSSIPTVSSSSSLGQTRRESKQKNEGGVGHAAQGGRPQEEESKLSAKSSKGYYWGTGGDLKSQKDKGKNTSSDSNAAAAPTWKTHVDINVYLLAIMSFIGWITFSIFGGIGIASLPLDAFLRFRARPRPISLLTFK